MRDKIGPLMRTRETESVERRTGWDYTCHHSSGIWLGSNSLHLHNDWRYEREMRSTVVMGRRFLIDVLHCHDRPVMARSDFSETSAIRPTRRAALR